MGGERRFWKVTRWARALRFWLFVVLALAAWLGFGGEASAQYNACFLNDRISSLCPSRESARTEALRVANLLNTVQSVVPACSQTLVNGNPIKQYRCNFRNAQGNDFAYRAWNDECPAGYMWDAATNTCTQACSSRPDLANRAFPGGGTVCVDSCAYAVVFDATKPGAAGTVEIGGMAYHWGTLAPTGSTCTIPTEDLREHIPTRSTCVATGGGNSECVEPSGRHCVTGAKGGRYCWQPGETGPRSNSQGTEGATRTPEGQTPQKPANMPNATGTQGATTTINNTTTTTTNYTGSGGTPGQGNVGTGGRDGPGGNGTGTGSGDGDGDEGEAGAPGQGVGDLYQGTDKTVSAIVGQYFQDVQQAAIFGAVGGFFDVSTGGSCPVFTSNIMGRSITIDFYCRAEFQSIWLGMGIFMLVIFSWAAFRVGVLD